MAKKRYYAVRDGRRTGVFKTWDECRAQVEGFPGARYKSFATEAEAEAFAEGIEPEAEPEAKAETKTAGEPPREPDAVAPEGDYAFVDGSWNDATKTYGYGGFVVIDGTEHIVQGSGDDEGMAGMRNVAGEVEGAMAAARLAMEAGCERLVILHDYLGIAKWVSGEWAARNEHTGAYRDYMRSVDAVMPLEFRHVKGHTGVDGNERADRLAKAAVGID